MESFFKNILIPVDFSINTEVAVKKAIEFAEPGTNIYILYVSGVVNLPAIIRRGLTFRKQNLNERAGIEHKLNEWKDSIIESGNTNKVFSIMVNNKSVQQAIIDETKRLNIDLIIIGKNSNHNWFPLLNTVIPSQLAKQTSSVVLTLKPGGVYNKIKTILIPITNENVLKKADVIHAICKRSPVRIQLIAFLNEEEKKEGNYANLILRLYQVLRASLNCQVEYTIVKNRNKARTILHYVRKYNADMLVVNPETETKIGWPNKYISDMLPTESKLQVWAV